MKGGKGGGFCGLKTDLTCEERSMRRQIATGANWEIHDDWDCTPLFHAVVKGGNCAIHASGFVSSKEAPKKEAQLSVDDELAGRGAEAYFLAASWRRRATTASMIAKFSSPFCFSSSAACRAAS